MVFPLPDALDVWIEDRSGYFVSLAFFFLLHKNRDIECLPTKPIPLSSSIFLREEERTGSGLR
jgi:hypothetical protein